MWALFPWAPSPVCFIGWELYKSFALTTSQCLLVLSPGPSYYGKSYNVSFMSTNNTHSLGNQVSIVDIPEGAKQLRIRKSLSCVGHLKMEIKPYSLTNNKLSIARKMELNSDMDLFCFFSCRRHCHSYKDNKQSHSFYISVPSRKTRINLKNGASVIKGCGDGETHVTQERTL